MYLSLFLSTNKEVKRYTNVSSPFEALRVFTPLLKRYKLENRMAAIIDDQDSVMPIEVDNGVFTLVDI